MIEFQECNYCEDNATARIGAENTPLCSKHFLMALHGTEIFKRAILDFEATIFLEAIEELQNTAGEIA